MDISIITPSYNQGEFIADTFESILAQVHDSFSIEYIVMDGLSSDNTVALAHKYAPKFAAKGISFQFVHKKDRGQTDAINRGLTMATGTLVTYLNSDDYYQPGVLQDVVEFFRQNLQIQWAYGGWNYINREGAIYSTVLPRLFSYSKLLDYCVIGQPSCFFRKSAFQTIGPFREDLHLAMDYEYWLRLSQHFPAGIIPLIISNMRYYGATKSGSQATAHLFEAHRLATRYTTPLSLKRMLQFFYLIRGYVVILLGIDITRRIEAAKKYGR